MGKITPIFSKQARNPLNCCWERRILLKHGTAGSLEFVRGGNKNKLSEENRARILDAFTQRADIEHFAKLVDNKTIGENDYNIAVSTYVA